MRDLSPPPLSNPELDSFVWKDWFRNLKNTLSEMVLEYIRVHTVTSISGSTALTDVNGTVVVTSTGLTITLPAASLERVGKIWTVNFSTTGTLTVQRAGSDTIMTDYSATDTSVIITVRGASIRFQCASSSTWILV